MAYNPHYFDLSEPLAFYTMNPDSKLLELEFEAWGHVEPMILGREHYFYMAEKRTTKGGYRIWIERAHPVESHLIMRWEDRYYDILSEPVYDPVTPWQYFIVEENKNDLSDFDET